MFYVPKTHAQLGGVGIANYLPINNSKVEDGDIIVSTPKGNFLSTTPYDNAIAGVVETHPAVAIRSKGNSNGYPVINAGTVYVKVSGINGNIKKGDFIATSSIPGTGMKLTQNGYSLGQASENITFTNKKEIKLVLIALNLHYLQLGSPVNSSLLDILNLSKVATYEQPTRVLQYVVAAIITLSSFGIGFLIFAKAINTGIEALGRNPLAGKQIQFSIIFNILLIIVIVAAGTALGYLVIRL